MNNDNIVKIGNALKWRNTFDITKKYYQENIVTICGCVFRCKVLQAQGKSPVQFTDDNGYMQYINTDTWDVVVDMQYYYNYSVDTKKLTKETLEYVKELDAAIKQQQKEIDAIKKDDINQWEYIRNIEDVNNEQQREIDTMLDTFSCFSEGIWINTLLWNNTTVWDNNKYAITDDLQVQINDINTHIGEHETAQKEYERINDLKLLVLSLGAKTTLKVSPNVVFKGVATIVKLVAGVQNIDDKIDSLAISQANNVIANTQQKSLTFEPTITTDDDIVFRAKTTYKGLELPVAVTLYARNPIYCGFGTVPQNIATILNQLSARTSAAGNYSATNNKDGQRYYILVPLDIDNLNDFTMGGAPYVMTKEMGDINGMDYYIYTSGALYNKGAKINITAK